MGDATSDRARPALCSVLVLGVLMLAGCGATPYQPKGSSGGYSEARLDATRFRVEFQGNEITPRDDVYQYLLFRCGELTVAAGYRDFVIMEFTGRPEIRVFSEIARGRDGMEQVVNQYQVKHGVTAVIAMSKAEDLAPGSTRLDPGEAMKVVSGERAGLASAVFDANQVIRHLEPRVKR